LADDLRFKDNGDRSQNRDELTDILRQAMVNEEGEALCARLLANNVPAGAVNDIARVMSHPHTEHRSMDARIDWYRGAGTPIKFSRTPAAFKTPPPKYGAHSREVMAAHGYGDDEVEALLNDEIVLEKRQR
tara:strand:- start:239 stop:631 length:393 start_codon:yes stop_codon:yes gene_type:complete